MSEQTPEDTTETVTTPEATTETPTPPQAEQPKPTETVAFWKQKAREQESRAKANADAAKRLAEIEEASKTEAQKQAEALAEAMSKVKAYEDREQVAAWKAEVSAETGVPVAALAGATKEEIEAHAATLKPLIAQQQPVAGHQPILGEGRSPVIPLNGDGLEAALKSALGIT